MAEKNISDVFVVATRQGGQSLPHFLALLQSISAAQKTGMLIGPFLKNGSSQYIPMKHLNNLLH